MGKYSEVLKGLLLASEPRFEFSHPRYLDLSPMFVFLAFCLTRASYIPSTPQLPEPGWNLWEIKHDKPFLHRLLLWHYRASLGAETSLSI